MYFDIHLRSINGYNSAHTSRLVLGLKLHGDNYWRLHGYRDSSFGWYKWKGWLAVSFPYRRGINVGGGIRVVLHDASQSDSDESLVPTKRLVYREVR